MKKNNLCLFVILVALTSLFSVESFRKALSFDTKIAYATNEPWYGWMKIDGIEVQIQFETTLVNRVLSLSEFSRIYGFQLESGTRVVEQWCTQMDNSLCEMRFVGSFLEENGHLTRLPVTPELMYY
jgi:hypothetical protein